MSRLAWGEAVQIKQRFRRHLIFWRVLWITPISQMLTWLLRFVYLSTHVFLACFWISLDLVVWEDDSLVLISSILQAAIEDIALKQSIFADLEKCCKPTCILASNTSTIDLELIGSKTMAQDRIIGAHFFRSNTIASYLFVTSFQHCCNMLTFKILTRLLAGW